MRRWAILSICLVASTTLALPAMAQEVTDDGEFQDYGDPVEILEDIPGQDSVCEDDTVGGDLKWKEGSYMRDWFRTVAPAHLKYRVFVNDAAPIIMNRTEVINQMEAVFSDRSVYCSNLAPDSVVPAPTDAKVRADGRCYLMSQRSKVRIADLVADLHLYCPPPQALSEFKD